MPQGGKPKLSQRDCTRIRLPGSVALHIGGQQETPSEKSRRVGGTR